MSVYRQIIVNGEVTVNPINQLGKRHQHGIKFPFILQSLITAPFPVEADKEGN